MISCLLVDDETPVTDVLSRALLAHGYTVRVAATGNDALLALAEELPGVMLLDINLPDITGWELLRRLPAATRSRLPIVVFSASPLAPSRVQEFQPAGMLIKPFPISSLLRLLREVTDQAVEGGAANG